MERKTGGFSGYLGKYQEKVKGRARGRECVCIILESGQHM